MHILLKFTQNIYQDRQYSGPLNKSQCIQKDSSHAKYAFLSQIKLEIDNRKISENAHLETNTLLNNTWVKTEIWKYSELTEKIKHSMSSFVGLLALDVLWMLFIKLKKSSSSPSLLRVWGYFTNMSGCWIMSNDLVTIVTFSSQACWYDGLH